MKMSCEKCGVSKNKNGSLITAIIRTRYVCNRCFNEIKTNNISLIKMGLNIPKDITLLK